MEAELRAKTNEINEMKAQWAKAGSALSQKGDITKKLEQQVLDLTKEVSEWKRKYTGLDTEFRALESKKADQERRNEEILEMNRELSTQLDDLRVSHGEKEDKILKQK